MNVRSSLLPFVVALTIGLCPAIETQARAGFITFDDESGFLAAAGNVVVESFENSSGANLFTLATPSLLVTHSGSGFTVLDTPSPFGTFATDGVRYLEEVAATTNEFRFSSFAAPLTAFGLFVTDYGDFGSAPLTMTINGTETFVIANPGAPDGSLLYFGVVATGADRITEVWLGSDDAIGIDEISLSAAVPEPSSLVLLGSGVVGLVAWRRRRRVAG